MSKRDFLLEIGVEELPARFIDEAINQLKDKVTKWFEEERLEYGQIEAYATPRRLALIVEGLAEEQQDISEEARGPAKKIAFDDEGNWTKAAEGFARGQGVSVDDLFFKEIKGVEYVFANKFVSGKETTSLLPALKEIITHLHFPQNMRWGSFDLRFARPIQWIVALFGKEVIPFTIENITTGAKSLGHRFLGSEVEFSEPSAYKETMREQFVIVDQDERKSLVREQIDAIANEHGWVIPIDEDLLSEVTHLVEYPTALYGSYDEKFLQLPREALITSMREHQRYFPVENKQGELLSYFVTVRNGDSAHLENVAKGNEKVLRARLADAAFFYEEDQRMTIDEALERLEQIVYHEELGSVGDKVRRVEKIAATLNKELDVNKEKAEAILRAAQICKFDLVTQMVNEFPELQGRMGEVYSELAGESAEVSKAINEYYKPRFSGDESPSSLIGTVVSVADKIDTIVTCFAIGLIPTGSQDPYALRRQAAGVIQMIHDHELSIEVEELIRIGLDVCEEAGISKRTRQDVKAELVDFFKLRVKAFLQDKQVKYDVIDAVLGEEIGHLSTLLKKANIITERRNDEQFKHSIEALSRVTNIARKAETTEEPSPTLFEKEQEQALYDKYVDVKKTVQEALAAGKVQEAFDALVECEGVINEYFDNIMVMSDDEAIKANRLAQMSVLAEVIRSFAHFQAIVFA